MRKRETKAEDDKSRVRIVNLNRDKKGLNKREAEQIKGGGAGGGGVIGTRRTIGEEIPSAQ